MCRVDTQIVIDRRAQVPEELIKPTRLSDHSTKRVSFVLTTMNRASRLDEVFEAAGTYLTPDDEFIVIDGNSTDHTGEVLSKYSDRISVFVSEPDVSAAHALNKGMLLATGKYIRPVCDDDILHPKGLEQAIQVMEDNPEVDLLLCGGTKEREGVIWDVWLPPGTRYGESLEDVFRYTGTGVGFVIRRCSLPLIGLVATGLASDKDYVLQAQSRGGTVRFCRINLFHHRMHAGSVSVSQSSGWEADNFRLAKLYTSRSFYYRYRVMRFIQVRPKLWMAYKHFKRNLEVVRKNPFLLIPRSVKTLIPGRAKSVLRRNENNAQVTNNEISDRWDGGFS